jgi:pimeloyl-ACP methyl ester carboxylesterase
MFLRGRDPGNPVLLYLHGGLPEYVLEERRPTALEDYFTVAWWEQRGAGLSYSSSLPRATMTIEQFIADTVSVTHYLRERFGKDRIYLMGHSGGSFTGIQAVARQPQLYAAYIGMAQMVDQLRSERRAYEFLVAEFEKRNDHRMLKKLTAAPVSEAHGTPKGYLAVRDKAMHRLGVGTTHDMRSVITGIFLPSLASPHYSLAEKVRLWRGKLASGVSAFGMTCSPLTSPSECPRSTFRRTSCTVCSTTPAPTTWPGTIYGGCKLRSRASTPSSTPRTARSSKNRRRPAESCARTC